MRMVGSVRWDGVEEKARREEREELDGMTLSDRPRERDMVARVGGLCRAEWDGWCEVGSCWIKCGRETGGGGTSRRVVRPSDSHHVLTPRLLPRLSSRRTSHSVSNHFDRSHPVQCAQRLSQLDNVNANERR